MKYILFFALLILTACNSKNSDFINEHLKEYYNHLNDENTHKLEMILASIDECKNDENLNELKSKVILLRKLSHKYSKQILDSGLVDMGYYLAFIEKSSNIGFSNGTDSSFIKHSGELENPLILANKILLTEIELRGDLLSNYAIDCSNQFVATGLNILSDGEYRFDIAFAEWQGKSMGEKVTVIVKGDSVTVRYEGDGNLTNSSPGDIFDKGKIRKHKSGVFIISNDPTDVDHDEVGGCGDGPAVIDFENKKYWLC